MRFLPVTALLALLACGCSSSGPSAMLLSDVIQFRPVLADDALAMKARTPEDDVIGVGDIIIADLSIDRIYMKKISDTRYDLIMTLAEAGGRSRWKKYYDRHQNATVALIIDGVVLRQFKMDEVPEGNSFNVTFKELAATAEEAERLQARLDAKATRAKPPEK